MDNSYHCDNCGLEVKSYAADTARASEAMLRVTLSDINAYLNDPETTIAQGDQIENILNAIDTILSRSSGEWLERHDAEIVTAISRDKNAALARAEKAEAERDGLAVKFDYMAGEFQRHVDYVAQKYNEETGDVRATYGNVTVDLARITAEARRKALLDLGRRFKDYDGSDSLTVEEAVARIEDLAQEADHA